MTIASTVDRPEASITRDRSAVPSAVEGRVAVSVDPLTDLSAREPGADKSWFDSIFIAGQVEARERRFGILVHILTQPASDARRLAVVVTDTANGTIESHSAMLSAEDYYWDRAALLIRAPGLEWSGDAQRQTVSVTTDWGAIKIDLEARGPALYYAGTGSFPLLGAQQWQFALPEMRCTGDLTYKGSRFLVEGEVWLDRQWGDLPDLKVTRWTWFNLAMPGGDKVAIWNARSADGSGAEDCWATILHPDGTHELVPVRPLADAAERFHESPTSDFAFPTKWTVRIPSRETVLFVTTTSIDQEIGGLGTSIYEGAATFEGTYRGRPVSGRTYVEQLGNWSR